MTDVSMVGAVLAGLVSFLSPCVLPLVPGYVSMLSGIGMEQLRQGQQPRAGLSASENHLSGMEIAGFESAQYFAFVVSDLSQNQVLKLARGLAPTLNETLHTTALKGLNPTLSTHCFKCVGQSWDRFDRQMPML